LTHVTDETERMNGSDQGGTETATDTPSMEEMLAELDAVKRDAAEMLDSLQRARAEFANYRRRIEQEQGRLRERATQQLVLRLLPVADDFERALRSVPADIASNTWIEGVRLVERKLWQALENEGVSVMESVGQPFDPSRHEAITVDEGAVSCDRRWSRWEQRRSR
jgi:molecular chaperone GrpE